jgi:hypothetical protein
VAGGSLSISLTLDLIRVARFGADQIVCGGRPQCLCFQLQVEIFLRATAPSYRTIPHWQSSLQNRRQSSPRAPIPEAGNRSGGSGWLRPGTGQGPEKWRAVIRLAAARGVGPRILRPYRLPCRKSVAVIGRVEDWARLGLRSERRGRVTREGKIRELMEVGGRTSRRSRVGLKGKMEIDDGRGFGCGH